MALINLENKTVLVVEDDEMSFLYLNQLFMLTKCIVFHAWSGSEALQMFRNNRIDLILMDIQLPDTDGIRVTREIRLSDRKIPIIAQTAGRTFDEKEKATEAGCNEVIVKPFSMEELFEAVGRQIGNLPACSQV
jgi:two-component system, cell cycle response regulator DivK